MASSLRHIVSCKNSDDAISPGPQQDPGHSGRKDALAKKPKDRLEGKSVVADGTGPRNPPSYYGSVQGGGRHTVRLPPVAPNRMELVYPLASSSHGDRAPPPGSSGCSPEYRAPPPGSYQDDDTGPSPKNLLMAVTGVKSAVNYFAKVLILDMKKFPLKLEQQFKETISREVDGDVGKPTHWKFLVQAFVCKRLFSGFDIPNGFYGIQDFEDLQNNSYQSFSNFTKFKDKSATIAGLLKDSPDISFLGKFCFQKFKSITVDSNTRHPFPIYEDDWRTIARERHPRSEFYQSFLKLAVSVWLLHSLAHSFEQGCKVLLYPRGCKFERKNMEAVIPGDYEDEDEDNDINAEVGFSIIPGFQVSKSVVKCEVYLVNKAMHNKSSAVIGTPEKTKAPGISFQSPDSFKSHSNYSSQPNNASGDLRPSLRNGHQENGGRSFNGGGRSRNYQDSSSRAVSTFHVPASASSKQKPGGSSFKQPWLS